MDAFSINRCGRIFLYDSDLAQNTCTTSGRRMCRGLQDSDRIRFLTFDAFIQDTGASFGLTQCTKESIQQSLTQTCGALFKSVRMSTASSDGLSNTSDDWLLVFGQCRRSSSPAASVFTSREPRPTLLLLLQAAIPLSVKHYNTVGYRQSWRVLACLIRWRCLVR